MELNPSNQLKVGIFLLIGLVTIMMSIFMLGADKAFFKSFIRVHANFEQVQGLAQGSIVSLAGVTVGNIEEINISNESNMLDVVLRIDQAFSNKLTEGSQVEIRTQGALGDKFVYIIPGKVGGPLIKSGDKIEVAKASDIIGIFSERGKETEKVFDIINELYVMTKTINGDGRLNHIMNNLASASSSLKDAGGSAQKFSAELASGNSPAKIRSSIDRLESILTKLDQGEGTLGALINDSALHDQLKTMLGGSTRKTHIKSLIRTSIQKSEGSTEK